MESSISSPGDFCHFRVESAFAKVEARLMALALVTCGPAYEPIDGVRRITNESTGEIGTILSESLSAFGFEVLCLRGEMSRHPAPKNARVVSFSTNGSLMEILEKLPSQPAAFFHAAALSDFSVRKIQGTEESAQDSQRRSGNSRSSCGRRRKSCRACERFSRGR